MSTLALILARGGSKGIPRKNCQLLAGKPLIAWTIEAALASSLIDHVIVSTEDKEIADISRQWGAQVPFMRPAQLATDDSPGMDAILHALDQLPQFEYLLVLQPTSPLRTTEDINNCINLALSRQTNSIVSVYEPTNSPYWMFQLGKDGRMNKLLDTVNMARRQDLPLVYALNGALYFAKIAWLRRTNTFLTEETIGFIMPPEKSIDIDTRLDWKIAELLLSGTP